MATQDASETLHLFASNLLRLRNERGLTQEALAFAAALDKSHIGYFEQLRTVPTLDTAAKIAQALNVPLSELFTITVQEGEEDNELARLNALLPYMRRYQELAEEYGIDDVFQDNGGKLLQMLVLTGLQNMAGREGNDAKDNDGTEWELKTVNQNLRKAFTTHHHLTVDIIAKYRTVKWLFCVYQGIEIIEIWVVEPESLEPLFQHWEKLLALAQPGVKDQTKKASLNNPTIVLSLVKSIGERYYSDIPDDKLKLAKKLAYFEEKFTRPEPVVKVSKPRRSRKGNKDQGTLF